MADYTKATGNAGTMMIRDLGSVVEFWIRSSDGQTYGYGLPFSWYANGQGGNGSFDYGGGSPWVRVLSLTVTTNQTIRFSIGDTGTWGLGGPTSFELAISRIYLPQAPTPIALDQIGHTTMRYRFSGNWDGGSPIREWQIGYDYAGNYPTMFVGSSGTTELSNLYLGQNVYVWARGRNDLGWGPWSSRLVARTLAGGRIRINGVWREAVWWIRISGVWYQCIPYVRSGGSWSDAK